MTEELERAKRAFAAQEPIRPKGDARRAAIAAAMTRFEQEEKGAAQGNSVRERLMESGGSVLAAFKRRRIMNIALPKRSHMLAGGVSLAALAFVAFNIGILQGPYRFSDPGVTPVANKPAKDDAATSLVDAVSGQSADIATEVSKLVQPEAAPAENEALQSAPARLTLQESVGARPKFKAESRIAPAQGVLAGRARESDGLAGVAPGDDRTQHIYQDQGRDKFVDITPNPVKLVSEAPVSTFSVDVDTASYAFVRSELNRGVLPQKDAVRVEEMINYFDYSYDVPADRAVPFNAELSIMPTPWNTETKLLRIGIKGYDLPKAEAPNANLVFLIDTSGSMNAPDKLPLLRNAFKLLVSGLKPDDTVAIVAYAGSAGTVLEPTRISEKAKILAALDQLSSGGSTAGAEGIRQAYQLAESVFDKDGVNRVILATDGDFNVGITDTEELKSFVERKRETGISLSVLGFGQGNYNDELMQTLAQNGNGNAAYIDTLNEARKTLVAEAGSTLFTIAKDVKLQLEFNPETVKEYRLIGYETRQLNREDFNNDKVDAGDIGAGHSVTALYELTPAGSGGGLVDDLRYKKTENTAPAELRNEYGFLKIRYKQPDSDTSELIEVPITTDAEVAEISQASKDTRFAASVAAFGQVLRGGRYTGAYSYDDIVALAQSGKGDDPYGYRGEFITLVQLANSGQALEPLKK
ncbi:von Willebrand factor type A domain-containing protein [Hoeflea sp. TYP-13]|uniref:vWA domain-containing protein n=1 Tax=Hoeflea sp. TYP-13 TaxID=3230023 RepID=UPI0034C6199D